MNTTVYPFGPNGTLPASVGIVNDLVTGGADKALSAQMGVELGKQTKKACAIDITHPQAYDSQVEYLGNDNSLGAYIDSGITASNKSRVVMAVFGVPTLCGPLFGSRVNNSPATGMFGINCSSAGTLRFDYGTTNNTVNADLLTGLHVVELDKNVGKIDGNVAHTFTARTFSNNLNIHVFGMNHNGTRVDMLQAIRVKYVKIYQDGALVRDFIPVRVGTTGYLYDRVSEQLFANAGSGAFVYGEDVPEEITEGSIQELHDYYGTQFNPKTVFGGVKDGAGQSLNDYFMVRKKFSGKIWAGLGDSLTYQDSSRYPGLSWSPAVENATGLVFKNCGVGNTCLAGSETNAFWKRLADVESYNPDIVTILGGANDLYRDIPIGTDAEFDKAINSKDCMNFMGAYSYIIETLLTWKPALRIVLLTTAYARTNGAEHTPGIGLTYLDYANATIAVAQYYGLPVVDLYRNMGINKLTQGDTYCRADHIHWNASACQIVASLLIAKLEEINNADV